MISKLNYKKLSVILISFTLFSCSTYPNKFKCGDAKGLGCTKFHDIYKQIESGQIQEVYKSSKKCKGAFCSARPEDEALIFKKKDKAKVYQDQSQDNPDNNNNLSF